MDINNKRKPLFRRENIIKLQRLMDMEYKPTELALEIGVARETVYRGYLNAGCPHTRDKANHIWINGESFKHWALTQQDTRKKHRNIMLEGQAWCIFCKKAIYIQNPRKTTINRYTGFIKGTCPDCGGKVNRVCSMDDKKG